MQFCSYDSYVQLMSKKEVQRYLLCKYLSEVKSRHLPAEPLYAEGCQPYKKCIQMQQKVRFFRFVRVLPCLSCLS